MEIDDVVDVLAQIKEQLDQILTKLTEMERTQKEIERKINK
jgi:hypothetical protein